MRLALSYLIALPLLTLFMFGGNLLGLPLTKTNAFLLLGITLFPLVFLYPHLPNYRAPITSSSKLSKVLKVIIISLLVIVIVNDSYRIVGEWDSLTLYDFRAQRIVETGSIAQAAQIQGSYFYSYPLFTSLFHAFMYLLGFGSPMLLYGFIFVSFITLFYTLLKSRVGESLALVGSLLLILAPHLFWHAQIAYTNLAYTSYLSLGALFLVNYYSNKNSLYAILGMFLTGVSVWVRSTEPFWLGNLILFLFTTLASFRLLDTLSGLLIFYPLEQLWKRYVTAMFHPLGSTLSQIQGSVQTVATAVTSPNYYQLITESLLFYTSSVLRPYAPVLLLFFVSLVIQVTKRKFNFLLPALIIFDLTIALVGTYTFAITQSYWREIPGSLERMMMFISPLIIYLFISTLPSKYAK